AVEFDHADIYKNLEEVETAFKRLVNLVPQRGKIVAFDHGESVERCVARAFCLVERYGTGAQSAWRVADVELQLDQSLWTVIRNGTTFADFTFALGGEYNIWNATAAAAIATNYGIPVEAIAGALQSFKSVKRRLEVKAEVSGITIIDD